MPSNDQLVENTSGLMEQMENLPASAYYWGALGSIGISALLMILGRKNASVFVGLWPPTIAVLGIFSKRFHPSQDIRKAGNLSGMTRDDANEFGNQAARAVGDLR